MILCYSGTGNSAYVAAQMAQQTGMAICSLNDVIKNHLDVDLGNESVLVCVSPTYCWRLPRILSDWMRKQTFRPQGQAYFVLTCGTDAGNAVQHLEKLCSEIGLRFMGCMAIQMPENYIALYSAPSQEECHQMIQAAGPLIEQSCHRIMAHQPFSRPKIHFADRCKSGFINDLFFAFIVSSRKFWVKENCIGCGQCARLCPLNNIQMVDGRPNWSHNCTHCMACISRCPKEAIEYGKSTRNKKRYYFSPEEV